MPVQLLATCWTHAGDALPVAGRRLSPLDLHVRAQAVAAAGFTGIGFTIDDLTAAQATYGLPLVKRICHDLGLVHLEVELLENWWSTGGSRRASDHTWTSLLKAADMLGARSIKIGPDVEAVDGAVLPLADVAHWAAELHELAVHAAEVGTRVALEPLPFSNVSDFRLAAELVAAADHPAAGLVVDIWHLERGPSTLADLAEIPGDKVFVVELKTPPRRSPPTCSTTRSTTVCHAAQGRSTSEALSRHCSRSGLSDHGVLKSSLMHTADGLYGKRWWTRTARRWRCSTAGSAVQSGSCSRWARRLGLRQGCVQGRAPRPVQ